jgi:hypothetical protein
MSLYDKGVFMSDKCQHLSRRLQSSLEKTRVFFEKIVTDQWETEIYSEGASWTLKQILVHNVIAEDSMLRLVKGILDGGEGVREDFDLDAYNEYKVDQSEKLTPQELLAEFEHARRETIRVVNGLSDADLETSGRHPWLGVAKIEEIIKLMFRHNQIHIREIRSALGG